MYKKLWQAVSQYARILEAQLLEMEISDAAPALSILSADEILNSQGTIEWEKADEIYEELKSALENPKLKDYHRALWVTEDLHEFIKKFYGDTPQTQDISYFEGFPVITHAHMSGVHYWVYVGGPK